MSVGTACPEPILLQSDRQVSSIDPPDHDLRVPESYISSVVERVQGKIAPVWPLKDYVAVNPYAGFAEQQFLTARQKLRQVSELETLMSTDYFREQFTADGFDADDISAAIEELVADGIRGAEKLDVNQIVKHLRELQQSTVDDHEKWAASGNPSRRYHPLSESLDRSCGSEWSRFIREEVSKHCAGHYDQGQAAWSSPWKNLPLYLAWKSAAQIDRTPEVRGLAKFRRFVAELPHQPLVALESLLDRLDIPEPLRVDYLLCVALTLPGWSAWTAYQDREAARCGHEKHELTGLLAILLAYEVALSECFNFSVKWGRDLVERAIAESESDAWDLDDDTLLRLTLLKASEVAFRRQLLGGLSPDDTLANGSQTAKRPLAQMVFCIDVRSERIRRHLEAASGSIETFGFAGFFGLPIEFVPLGETEGVSHVPVLISPQFRVQTEVEEGGETTKAAVIKRRNLGHFLRKAWKEFQTSSASCFSFVESTGLFYGVQLLARSMGWGTSLTNMIGKLADGGRSSQAPTLQGLHQQGITTSRQADLAESILRGIGIVEQFGRLVVFCGHSSETDNNPLKAGLDCGACGGHSGEPNARLAARLLNQQSIRQSLQNRGIDIPDDTWFVAALHNTTTDMLEFFDTQELPASHRDDLKELEEITVIASQHTRLERLSQLPGSRVNDLFRRSCDWAEVRPEWGLAGNAAFIAAPRSLTYTGSLDGRAFLHSYDFRNDPECTVLEQIMTAPLIVAHWINMQYYASTVDPTHFGSGTKTVHNVVGQFGIQSGNGGDLMTGLPWQSVHDGTTLRHHPLRLLAVIAAPREAIDAIIDRHDLLMNLLSNGWLHLVAVDDGEYFRFTGRRTWDQLTLPQCHEALC